MAQEKVAGSPSDGQPVERVASSEEAAYDGSQSV